MSKNRELIVYLKGGLGNQLFQLLAGLYFAKTSGRKLVYDDSWYLIEHAKVHSQRTLRVSELTKWINIHQGKCFGFKCSKIFLALIRRLPKTLQRIIGFFEEISREDRALLERDRRKKLVISGYWMEPPIFDHFDLLSNAVRQYGIENSGSFRELHDFLKENCVIAMHIRLGDYKDYSEIYDVINLDYYARCYQEARKVLEKNYKNIYLWVFTDEIEVASKLYGDHFQVHRWVSRNEIPSDLDTMCLLSKSTAIICANSSFSWWAAAISKEAQIVYFPREYMVGKSSDQMGLIRSGWRAK